MLCVVLSFLALSPQSSLLTLGGLLLRLLLLQNTMWWLRFKELEISFVRPHVARGTWRAGPRGAAISQVYYGRLLVKCIHRIQNWDICCSHFSVHQLRVRRHCHYTIHRGSGDSISGYPGLVLYALFFVFLILNIWIFRNSDSQGRCWKTECT